MNLPLKPQPLIPAGVLALGLALCTSSAIAEADGDIVRHPIPGSDFPIALAVNVPDGHELVFLSGQVPRPADPDAEEGSPAYWGDTEAQTRSVMQRIESALAAQGLTVGDIVKMQAFLVAPPGESMMDFAGFMAAYSDYFGGEDQPNLPARTTVQIAGLAGAGMLVEIDVIAARRSE